MVPPDDARLNPSAHRVFPCGQGWIRQQLSYYSKARVRKLFEELQAISLAIDDALYRVKVGAASSLARG